MWFDNVKNAINDFLEIPAVRNAITILLILFGILRVIGSTDIGKKVLRKIEAHSKQTIEALTKTIAEKDDEIKKIKEQYEQQIKEIKEQYENRLDKINEKVDNFDKKYTKLLALIPNKRLQDELKEYESGGTNEEERKDN